MGRLLVVNRQPGDCFQTKPATCGKLIQVNLPHSFSPAGEKTVRRGKSLAIINLASVLANLFYQLHTLSSQPVASEQCATFFQNAACRIDNLLVKDCHSAL
ncbi:MAG: hypothetical protein IPM55_00010 [Acidobacteria bacterium]|nr:hypothetical protein [Acidobacteriota bacterium]